MPRKKYIVTLTDEERQQIETLSQTGKRAAYVITHARILLKADTAKPDGGWCDREISAGLDVGTATVEHLRQQFVEEGLEACLNWKTRVYERLLDGEQEAYLIAIACSSPPAGQSRWTLRLLSERSVELGDVAFPDAIKVRVVQDNLNTHVKASLYKAFEAAEARRILNRLDFHYTPKHGSCLNMAEIELSVRSRQCLDRRIPDKESLKSEVAAWENRRNQSGNTIEWRFTTQDARIKLKHLYPSFQEWQTTR